MKRNKKGNLKRIMGIMMMVCMLLTLGSVSSDAEYGIMPCGEAIEDETRASG